MSPPRPNQNRLQNAQKRWAIGHKQPSLARNFARAQTLNIQKADIMFLTKSYHLENYDHHCLIDSRYMPQGTTGHPVIVLQHISGSTHAIVSTISAYSSGPWNDNLAPWKQEYHKSKRRVDFRAFHGSEQPDEKRPLLQLEGGKQMPKPEVSWIYTKNVYVVPTTALKNFDKSSTRLRMAKQSFDDLLAHTLESPQTRDLLKDPRLSYFFVNGSIKAPTLANPQGFGAARADSISTQTVPLSFFDQSKSKTAKGLRPAETWSPIAQQKPNNLATTGTTSRPLSIAVR
jgi:hypothetical protein